MKLLVILVEFFFFFLAHNGSGVHNCVVSRPSCYWFTAIEFTPQKRCFESFDNVLLVNAILDPRPLNMKSSPILETASRPRRDIALKAYF